MKKLIYVFSVTALAGGLALSSCSSDETAGERLDRMSNSVDEKTDNVAEWIEFRKAAKAEIAANRQKIAELRVKQESQGDLGTKISQERIDKLQAENERLQTKMNKYDPKREGEGQKWESFKKEFRHDMDELGNSIRNVGENNVEE